MCILFIFIPKSFLVVFLCQNTKLDNLFLSRFQRQLPPDDLLGFLLWQGPTAGVQSLAGQVQGQGEKEGGPSLGATGCQGLAR